MDIRPGGSVNRQRQLVSEVCALCVVCCVSVRVEFRAVWLLLPRADRGRRGERCGSCYQTDYLVTGYSVVTPRKFRGLTNKPKCTSQLSRPLQIMWLVCSQYLSLASEHVAHSVALAAGYVDEYAPYAKQIEQDGMLHHRAVLP